MANEPTFNPNAYRDFDEATRRNRAVQDLYEPGSTFKVVTASAAHRREGDADRHADRHQPGPDPDRHARRQRYQDHNYGVLSFTDVIVKSSNVGAIKIGFKVGTERLSGYVSASASAVRLAGFPGESPGIVWDADEVDRQRAGVGVDGLPGRRHAAADGGGGQLGRQRRRVRRAARRARRLSRRPALRGAAEGRAAGRSAPTPPRR